MSFIHVEGLSKRFVVRKKRQPGHLFREKTSIQALNDVSFDIEQGELIGYIGPNGAGKSTTVKILSGILTPDAGQALVNGIDLLCILAVRVFGSAGCQKGDGQKIKELSHMLFG